MVYIIFMTEAQVRAKLVTATSKYKSMRQAAKDWGMSPAYLSDVLLGRRGISDATAGIVGYKKVESPSTYVKK